jgi:hypothetical protein
MNMMYNEGGRNLRSFNRAFRLNNESMVMKKCKHGTENESGSDSSSSREIKYGLVELGRELGVLAGQHNERMR